MRLPWVVLIGVALTSTLTTEAQTYTTFAVQTWAHVAGINSSGQVTGNYRLVNHPDVHLFIRNPDGTLIKAGAANSVPTAINAGGEIVGNATTKIGGTLAFYRLPSGTYARYNYANHGASAVGVNDAGYIAGVYADQNYVRRAYLRDPQGTMTTLPIDGVTSVGGLNNSNQVVDALSGGTVFIYSSQITEFTIDGAATVQPTAISDVGEVVGTWFDSNGVSHGFTWTSQAGVTSFDGPQALMTYITAVNAPGTAVGYFQDPMTWHAFILDSKGTLTILHPPNSVQSFATGINASGQVAGEYDLPKVGTLIKRTASSTRRSGLHFPHLSGRLLAAFLLLSFRSSF
jgi:uncharacterized membrane protein